MTSDEAGSLLRALDALGQNGGMPASLSHPPQMPEAALRAQRATAAPTRAVVLRYLIQNPASTATEIGAATGAKAIHPALLELEQLGFVTGDIEGNRNGRKVRYTVDRVALRDALDAFTRWVMGDDQA
jgi:hypothetical protein